MTLLGLTLGASACQSLSPEEEARLAVYRENSQHYYDRGDYARALHQADSALELDPEITSVRLVKGFCLLKLGKRADSAGVINKAIEEFDAIADTSDGADDFRVYLGLGTAHLARALVYDSSIVRVESRMTSEFLSSEARTKEQAKLDRARERRADHLVESEAALHRVLAFELQKNNVFALIDLVLVLHSQGGHEAEAKTTAERALALLDEANLITANSLKRNAALSAVQRLDLENRIKNNHEKERQLRDLLATIDLSLGDTRGYLEQMQILEARDLMGEVQYYNRAQVHEDIGLLVEALGDLEQFLRLRSRRFDYEQDNMAPEVFSRIEALRARIGAQAAR
jgi:tetratricopeptide (TPR) repeat protein